MVFFLLKKIIAIHRHPFEQLKLQFDRFVSPWKKKKNIEILARFEGKNIYFENSKFLYFLFQLTKIFWDNFHNKLLCYRHSFSFPFHKCSTISSFSPISALFATLHSLSSAECFLVWDWDWVWWSFPHFSSIWPCHFPDSIEIAKSLALPQFYLEWMFDPFSNCWPKQLDKLIDCDHDRDRIDGIPLFRQQTMDSIALNLIVLVLWMSKRLKNYYILDQMILRMNCLFLNMTIWVLQLSNDTVEMTHLNCGNMRWNFTSFAFVSLCVCVLCINYKQ